MGVEDQTLWGRNWEAKKNLATRNEGKTPGSAVSSPSSSKEALTTKKDMNEGQ